MSRSAAPETLPMTTKCGLSTRRHDDCAGVMTDATLPPSMRWIPKGMTVEYLKKAKGTLHGIATPDSPLVDAAAGYDLPVSVVVTDAAGDAVFRAKIAMWVSPRSKPA